ncbi:MAG: hypothetical protein FWD47_10040 [Treponema sp.]|nr:hypothetical protein [Treponema sp.]
MKLKKIVVILIILSLAAFFISCEDMCIVCTGSGKCNLCSGKIPIDGNPCPRCQDSKICFNCNGKGKIQVN